MKDMYIDYGDYRRRNNKSKMIRSILILIVIVLIVGAGGYFFADYYYGVVDEQDNPSTTEAAESGNEAGAESSIFETEGNGGNNLGIWYPENTEGESTVSESNAYDVDRDLWMGDFKDDRTKTSVKGVYVSAGYLLSRFDDILRLIDETELNAMVIDVKTEEGSLTLKSDSELVKETGADANSVDMESILNKLHEHNVYAVARIVSMMDNRLAKARPELAVVKRDGSLMKDSAGRCWLNPYKDGVWDYLIELGAGCAEIGFDEINYDYICFSTDKKMSDVDFSSETRTRQEVIADGTRRICETLKPMGVFVSCDVYGTVVTNSVDAKVTGQNYFRMSQYLDYICPIIYPSHYGKGYYNFDVPDAHPYELVYNVMMDSKKVLYMIDDTGNKAIVRPWLQAFTASWVKGHIEYGAKEIRDQINGVYDSGHSEWLLWNAAANYNEKGLVKN